MENNLFKGKNARIAIWGVAIIAVAAFFWLTAPRSANKPAAPQNVNGSLPAAENANTPANTNANVGTDKQPAKAVIKKPAAKPVGFTEKRAPHFVSSSIANNATLSQVPSNLTLTFDAPLQKNTQTTLTVKKDDISSAITAPSSINDKTLSVGLNTQAVNGSYYVYYVACFADTGCKDGRFGYTVKLPK
jgi:methionine-rich copper-binding protein CopC